MTGSYLNSPGQKLFVDCCVPEMKLVLTFYKFSYKDYKFYMFSVQICWCFLMKRESLLCVQERYKSVSAGPKIYTTNLLC